MQTRTCLWLGPSWPERMCQELTSPEQPVNAKRPGRRGGASSDAVYRAGDRWPQAQPYQAQPDHTIYTYLLRGVIIERTNQVWPTDIAYVPMVSGSMYLCRTGVPAIIDRSGL